MYLEQYNNWMNQENLETYLKEQLKNLTEAEIEDAWSCWTWYQSHEYLYDS